MTNENDREKPQPSQQPSKPQPQKEPVTIPLREGTGRPAVKRENDKNNDDDGERIFRKGE
jgi:hypothetical protein